MRSLAETPLAKLRIAGACEGVTLVTLLFIAVPLKYIYGLPALVSIIGPIHGLAFIVYFVVLMENIAIGNWSAHDIVRTVSVSLIPFGTFYNDRWLARRAKAGA